MILSKRSLLIKSQLSSTINPLPLETIFGNLYYYDQASTSQKFHLLETLFFFLVTFHPV